MTDKQLWTAFETNTYNSVRFPVESVTDGVYYWTEEVDGIFWHATRNMDAFLKVDFGERKGIYRVILTAR